MIEKMEGFLKMLLMLAPFLVLVLLSIKANLKRPERYKQFPMPVIAVIFCLVGMLGLDYVYKLALELLESVPEYFRQFARWTTDMNPDIGVQVTEFARVFQYWYNTLNLPYWAFYVVNILLMLAFVVVKFLLCPLFRKLFRQEGAIFQALAGICYDLDEDSGNWHLQSHYAQGRTLLKACYVGVILLGVVTVLLSSKLYLLETLTTPYYPVFSVIVVGELLFFLNGMTLNELRDWLGCEEEKSKQISDYSIMRRVLRKLFPDKLNAENTTVSAAGSAVATTEELLTELEASSIHYEEAYGRFMRRKSEEGLVLDRNYLVSGRQLLNGDSILFNNPFYYDLIPYMFYPMNRCLLRHKKILIVLGRHGTEENMIQWCREGLTEVTNVSDMWNIGVLSQESQDLDVGIINRSSVHDLKLHEANSEFFDKTEYVVLIEPSRLITTAQVGLNSIVRHCRRKPKQLVFCSTDKNCDGLVDALSHILMTSLQEVSATNHHTGASSYMIWEADKEHLQHRMLPNLSRYMGMGTELSFAALKNQVPETYWFGGDGFPVVDIHWIVRQYYYDLLRYANLPAEQEVLDRVFQVSVDMWNARKDKKQYITVEDESFNMFEVKRDFATRATEQGFVNVISTEYLLKDYMAANDSIFNADAKAIPYITADYARTARNVVLRLCLRMSCGVVPESEIAREMLMIDRESKQPARALWHEICATCGHVGQTTTDRFGRKTLSCATPDGDVQFGMNVLIPKRRFSMETGAMETVYTITDHRFIRLVLGDLRLAQYIAEDENGQRQYLGSELAGQIFQKYLPGQFFTFGGKYYEMLRVTSDSQVLVRRASDHIEGRPTYRQERNYFLSAAVDSTVMGECRDMGTMRVTRQFADIRVQTPAYYAMDRYNDFVTGKRVGINGVPDRVYNNKAILRLDLNPGIPVSAGTMNTLVLLMNEVLRTLLAENQDYLAVLTPGKAELPNACSLEGENGFQPVNGSIYIIEDSQMDIGLLDAVERNMNRLCAIVCDYLQWHNEAMELSKNPPPAPPEPESLEVEHQETERKGVFRRFWEAIRNFLKKIFGRKKPVEENPEGETPEGEPSEGEIPAGEEQTESAEASVEEAAAPDAEEPAVGSSEYRIPGTELPEEGLMDIAAGGDNVEFEDDEAQRAGAPMFTRLPYHKRYYLLYGGEDVPQNLDLAGVQELLEKLGYGNSALTQARRGKDVAGMLERNFTPNKAGVHYCDFCGSEMTGLGYDVLGDGRERCTNCSRTAVKNLEEFISIHDAVRRNLQTFFGIRINARVSVQMVNSKKIQRKMGNTFVPTGKMDVRALGIAVRDRNGYSILIENGTPRLQATLIMVHEMTHIWQFLNWNDKDILRRYGKELNLEVYEGMAKWTEVQYAYLLGEIEAGKREEMITRLRDDEYGRGFIKYAARYPLSTGPNKGEKTPFDDRVKPL